MAWTAPMTFVANAVLTSSQMNIYVRDNLNETAPAKATTEGSYFVTTNPNSIVERVGQRHTITTQETTTSTSYTNLSTVGPTVTATTGHNALVIIGCELNNSSTGTSRMTVDVTGASTIAGTDTRCVAVRAASMTTIQASVMIWYDDLTPGVNTFTCKYKVTSGTGTFDSRRLIVLPY